MKSVETADFMREAKKPSRRYKGMCRVKQARDWLSNQLADAADMLRSDDPRERELGLRQGKLAKAMLKDGGVIE